MHINTHYALDKINPLAIAMEALLALRQSDCQAIMTKQPA